MLNKHTKGNVYMRIGFDGKRVVQNYTGLGNYSRYIIGLLCRNFPENEYIAYAPQRKDNVMLGKMLKEYPQFSIKYPIAFWNMLKSAWRVWGIITQLRTDNIDVFHGLSNELPLNIKNSRVRSIVTIHDLIFLRFPQFYPLIDRKIYTFKFGKACHNADKIIAISECTKRDIMFFFKIPSEKIEVLYQGCDRSFSIVSSENIKEDIRDKYQLPERYILNVGRIEERKNVLLAVKALSTLPTQIHLVIVGHRTSYVDLVEGYSRKNGLADRVHILDGVPNADLPTLYQLAEIFVYPSRYEGFGIPILEALNSGVPVVAAIGSCLEEAGGPDSLYVDPDDFKGLAEAFIRIMTDSQRRQQMIERGRLYAKRFEEERQAEVLGRIYGITEENLMKDYTISSLSAPI